MARGPQASITPPVGAVAIPAGSSIQTAINANPTGTAFALGVGTHTVSASITPKTGNTFVGVYGAVLDGTGWAFTGDLNVGAFRAHNQDIDNVTIRNLTIRNMPMRAVHAFNGPNNWVVEDCDLLYNRNAVRIAADSIVRRCRILYNRGDDTNPNPNLQGGGYGSYQAVNCTFEDNEIAYNGPEQKFFESTNTTFTNNFIHDSDHGIWFDGCDVCTATGNTIEDCRIGIEYEISRNGTLSSNTIRRCTGWGIFVSCSFNADIYGNVVQDCFKGIQYFLDCARAGTVTGLGFAHDLKDNDTYANTIRIPTTANATGTSLVLLTGTCNAAAITLYTGGTKNLTFEGNVYTAPTVTGNNWTWQTNKSWAQWQALGNDDTGSLALTGSEATMSKGNTFENDLLKLIFWGTPIANLADNAASSPLTSLYLSLHTADPGETADQTTNEVAYTSYARMPVVRSSSGWAITANSVSPTAVIAFPTCTGGGPVTVTHAALGTALSGTGKVLYKGSLAPNIGVVNGVIPRLLTASTITED